MSSFLIDNNLIFPQSPLSLILLSLSSLLLILAILLYTFQGRLIYLPQFPPGSRREVWLPSQFGYGPGKSIKPRNYSKKEKEKEKGRKEHDSDDEGGEGEDGSALNNSGSDSDDFRWEEVEIVTKDMVKLQAYWIKASSTTRTKTENDQKSTDLNDEPFTILYMQANAGNIVYC